MEHGPVKSCLSLPTHLKEKIRVCVTVWEERETDEAGKQKTTLANASCISLSQHLQTVRYYYFLDFTSNALDR